MRQPSIGRLIALLTGTTVVLLFSIDSTMACRLFFRRHAPMPYISHCAPPPNCRVVIQRCPPVHCCGDGVVVDSVYDGGRVVESDVPLQPTPALEFEVERVDELGNTTSPPPPDVVPTPLPGELEAERADDFPAVDVVEPAIVEEPADDLIPLLEEPATGDDPLGVLPPDEAIVDELPDSGDLPNDDDLFVEPAADLESADAPTDDVFDPLADEVPSDDLDIFDQPASDDALPMVEDPLGVPADDPGLDEPADLFDRPVPADTNDDLPGFDEPIPTEEPADAAPADEPAASDDLDDLFGPGDGVGDADAAPAAFEEPAADDLFDAPADTPADAPGDDGNDAGDLDDLFSIRRPVPAHVTEAVNGESDELPMRHWVDNTGTYRTVGRLIKISPTHVRLLKDNGRFSTVPKRRLSPQDLTYVQELQARLGVEYFDQLVRR